MHYLQDACYDRGAPLFFLVLLLNLGAQDLSQKLIWKKIKLVPDGKSRMTYSQLHDKNHVRKRNVSDDLGLRSRVIQKPFQAKTATSIVARVPTPIPPCYSTKHHNYSRRLSFRHAWRNQGQTDGQRGLP